MSSAGSMDASGYAADVLEGENLSQERWVADNSELKADTEGLAYRKTSDMNDRIEDFEVKWGETIMGTLSEDGHWLKTGKYYLPMKVNGSAVLRREQEPNLPPKCPKKGCPMIIPDDMPIQKRMGYICEWCGGASRHGHLGGSTRRWKCIPCNTDLCFECCPEMVDDRQPQGGSRASEQDVTDGVTMAHRWDHGHMMTPAKEHVPLDAKGKHDEDQDASGEETCAPPGLVLSSESSGDDLPSSSGNAAQSRVSPTSSRGSTPGAEAPEEASTAREPGAQAAQETVHASQQIEALRQATIEKDELKKKVKELEAQNKELETQNASQMARMEESARTVDKVEQENSELQAQLDILKQDSPGSAHANGVVPPQWDRVKVGFSNEMKQNADSQRAVAELAKKGDMEALEKKHSKFGSVKDPCGLAELAFKPSGACPEEVESKRKSAEELNKESDADFKQSCAGIDKRVQVVKDLHLSDLESQLLATREEKTAPVTRHSEKLADTVEGKKGLDEVLRNYGIDPQNLPREVKQRRRKEAREELIRNREEASIKAATELVDWNNGVKEKLGVVAEQQGAIAGEKNTATKLQNISDQGVKLKQESAEKVEQLKRDNEKIDEVVSNAKASKKKDLDGLDKMRDLHKKSLEQSLKTGKDYDDAYVRHESKRILVSNLEIIQKESRRKLKQAQAEHANATKACDKLTTSAQKHKRQLDDKIQRGADDCVQMAAGPAKAAALSVKVSEQLLENVQTEQADESRYIEEKKRQSEEQQAKLEEAKAARTQDRSAVEGALDELKDEQALLNTQAEKNLTISNALRDACKIVRDAEISLVEVDGVGKIILDDSNQEAMTVEAKQLANKVFTMWPFLWDAGSGVAAPPGAPAALPSAAAAGTVDLGCTDLTAIPENEQLALKNVLQMEKQIQQMKAILMYRQGAGSSSAGAAGSEAGTDVSWDKVDGA